MANMHNNLHRPLLAHIPLLYCYLLGGGPGGGGDVLHAQRREERVVGAEHNAVRAHLYTVKNQPREPKTKAERGSVDKAK